MLERLEPLTTAADLLEWATGKVRYDHNGQRWLLLEADHLAPRDCTWYLTRTERPAHWSINRRPTQESIRVGTDLGQKLARRWRVQRNRGRSYLSPTGILDLVDPAGTAVAKREGKRLADLDAARWGRVSVLRDRAGECFEAVQRVGELRDASVRERTEQAAHALDRARSRASDRASEWMERPAEALGGRRPREAAEAGDEGLAEALFHLEGTTGVQPRPMGSGRTW